MGGIGVILNPNSKRYKRNPEKLKRMGFIVGDKGSFSPTKDLNDIRRVAEEFLARDIDILALSGGDGTNHRTLTTFIETYGDRPLPKIALLRGGTLNTIATSCGIFGTPEKILSDLLYKYHEDEPFETTQVDIMKINQQYGFIWGMGVIHRFMQAYYHHGEPSPMRAATTLAKSIGSAFINGPFACQMFSRVDGEVISDGERWAFRNYSAIFAGSISQLGLGFQVFRLVGSERKFHGIGFSMPPRNVLKCVPFLFLGKSNGCSDWIDRAASTMTVQLSEPCGYIIDGDLHPPTDRFELSLGPRLTFIVR